MLAHASRLAARGHDVAVFTSKLRFPNGELPGLADKERLHGFEIHRLAVFIRALPFFIYPSNGGLLIPELIGALGEFKPEIIHVHNIGAASWAHLAARYAKPRNVPLFYSTHHHPSRLRFDRVRKLLLTMLNRLPLRVATKIYHLTNRDLSVFREEYPYADPGSFSVLSNGIDALPASGHPISNGKTRLLFVGRVDDRRKGFAVLEAALATFTKAEISSIRLTVVGAITKPTKLRLEKDFGQSIEILGFVDEDQLEIAYSSADIFVMPSLYEGFGMPYLEAMRYGIPVIGSDVGGIPEVVPADTGILIEVGDSAALAEAIRKLINDVELRHAYGAAGKMWSKRFEWESIVDNLEADYRASLLASQLH